MLTIKYLKETFYFEIILDLEKSCKNSWTFPYNPTQLPVAFPNVNTLYNHSAVTKTKK